jgi:hypothetical protein
MGKVDKTGRGQSQYQRPSTGPVIPVLANLPAKSSVPSVSAIVRRSACGGDASAAGIAGIGTPWSPRDPEHV